MGTLLGVGRGAPRTAQAPTPCVVMQHKSQPRNRVALAAGLPQRNTRATTLGWL
jgi:hypothetical protein